MDLKTLQVANMDRAVEWFGDTPRSSNIEFSVIELGGETGELLNKIKKLLRHQRGMVGGTPLHECKEGIADELADIVICCDLVASSLDIDLSESVVRKFNKTSDKHGFFTKLGG